MFSNLLVIDFEASDLENAKTARLEFPNLNNEAALKLVVYLNARPQLLGLITGEDLEKLLPILYK